MKASPHTIEYEVIPHVIGGIARDCQVGPFTSCALCLRLALSHFVSPGASDLQRLQASHSGFISRDG
eukprot:1161491-Pelagomonas_calceolata.AAC.3